MENKVFKVFEAEEEVLRYFNNSKVPTLAVIHSRGKYYVEDDACPFMRNGETIIAHRIDGKVVKSK